MIDTHTHSIFSADGKESAENLVLKAIELGLRYLAITDHLDRDYLFSDGLKKVRQLDTDAVYSELLRLREKYKNKILLAIGLETGFSKEAEKDILTFVNAKKYDYIINSVHVVNGKDAYYPDYFIGKDKKSTYEENLDCVLLSLDACYHFDAVGHIGYISRYAPFVDRFLDYDDFPEKIDLILKKIIQKDVILELNTNSNGSLSPTLANYKIVKRYRQLGGSLVSFASDAHTVDRIADGFDLVSQSLKEIGFNKLTYCFDGKRFYEYL